MLALDLKFKITPQEIGLDFGQVAPVTEKEIVLEKDHTQLTGRDAPDQHPMGAISGLEDSLDGLGDDVEGLTRKTETLGTGMAETMVRLEKTISENDALSNLEIQAIMQQ